MVNTAIVGCNGKMGCFVAQAVQSREDCNVLFGVDAFGESNYDFDVFKTFDEATETPDVIIDFSNPAALDGAGGVYFFGRKENTVISDRELIKMYRGGF